MINLAQIGAINSFTHAAAGGDFDEDYQAVLDFATGQAYSLPSSGVQTLGNQLVLDLKAANIWDLLDVFWVFATDGDSDFATINWKDPSAHQCTRVNTLTFTANEGYAGNASNSYLNTNFVPETHGVNYALNDALVVIYYNAHAAFGSFYDGCRDATNLNQMIMNPTQSTNMANVRINTNNSVSFTNTSNPTGMYFFGRSSLTEQFLRVNNGSLSTTSGANSSARASFNFYLGGGNTGGTAGLFHARQMSMAALGSAMTSSHGDFYTAWNTYFTSL